MEVKDQAMLDQTLSDLTGFNSDFFINSDPCLLRTILPMLDDDNTKALSAWILRRKDPKIYGEIYECMMADINLEKLAPKVRALFREK